MKSASRILGGMLVLFVIALVFLQGKSESSTPVAAQERSFSVSEPVTPHLSAPVHDLPTGNSQPLLNREINPLKNPHLLSEGMGIKGSQTIGMDPYAELSRTSNTGNTPSTIFTFEGLGTDGFTPPDTVGDVGPNHYVQMVNVSFAIWEKNADPDLPPTLVQPDTLFNQLFAGFGGECQNQNDGDPIVLYDELADRWLLSQFAVSGPLRQCVAISQTPDPTGAYYLYDFPMPDFPDYFKFGVWTDGYYMSTNTGFPNQYYAHVFDRDAMLAGQPATVQSFGGHPNFMMPSDIDGNTPPPAGSPNYFYTFLDANYPDHPAGVDRLAIYEFDVDWDTPANSTFTLAQEIPIGAYNYTVCGFFVQNCIPQPGTSQRIDSLSYWPMFRFAYRNQGAHEAMVGNFTVDLDGTDKAAIRWFELRKSGAGDWALHQEGTHAPDSDHRWMGSIAMDSSGNIALGYSVSSATTFPSLRYATRLESDPAGTLQTEASLWDGAGSQTGVVRWGDYSAMSIDPADGCTFWYTTEYHDVNDTGFNWNTRIGTFRLDSCGTADFTLNASPAEQDICLPDEAIFNVNVGQVQDYDDDVALTANNLPGSATATFNPSTVTPSTPPATSVLTISNTASITPGSYTVEIMGTAPTSTHTTTVGINIFDSIPLSPTLSSPADAAIAVPLVPTFEWMAPAQGTDYYLEVASDMAFTTVVYSAMVDSTSHTMNTALDPLSTYYWRVRADNLCGEGAVSAIWSFTTADIPPILVVDDDDNSPDVRSSYTDVLDALGLQYDVWDTNGSDNEPSAVDLAPYNMVIWFTGVAFGGSAGPGSAGEAALSTFLDSGQCLFISSQDYFYDRGLTSFMQEYLGVVSATSDVSQTTVTGEGIVFGGLGPYSLSYPFTNYSDIITPDATAELAFSGDMGDAAVDKDSGVYRTTFFGYPFEALPAGTAQETVMQTIVDWCGTGIATGTLEGTVTDGDSGDGIEGATITADNGSNQRTVTTDENGDYTMRLAIGTYDVTASEPRYVSEVMTDVVIITDTTTTADFVLQGSSLTYSPAEIEEDMEIGDVVSTTVTVTATGPLSVSFNVSIGNFGGPGEELSLISIPASDGNFPRGDAAPSFGRPPLQNRQPESQNPVNLSDILGSSAYATDAGQGFFAEFDVEVGGALNNIGPFADFVWAGDFLGGDFGMVYLISDSNMLEMVNTSDASRTPIGPSVPFGAQGWTGMAGDPTSGQLYASSCDITASSIYTIDTNSGEATRIAPITNSPCTIAIAIDDSGQMYGYDIVNDSLIAIDKATGEGTIIGSLGFDANFGQGMDYDSASGNLYLSAFNNGTFQAELRIADTTTGNTTLVNVLGTPGLSQLGWMAAASGGSGGPNNWASAVPDSGTVNANGTTTFEVVFDARSLYEVGQYTAELSFNGSFVNDVETMPLTMNLTCPTCGFLDGSITDLETGDPVNAHIHITSTNGFDVMLSGDSYDIAVQPGTYNITVSANGYFDESDSVTVSTGATVTTDFVLTPMIAMLEYTPAEIEEDMEIGDVVTNVVTVENTGYVDLEFNVNIGGYDGPGIQVVPHSISLPASDGNFPRGTHEPSFAQAPIDSAKGQQNSSLSDILGSSAYATDAGQGFFAEFDVEVGGALNNIGSFASSVWAGDFLGGDFSMAYVINSDANMLEMVNTSDASRTTIGSSIPFGSESWTGMAGDPTSGQLYASSCDITASSIYTIDTNSGEATRIAPITNSPCTIAIAIDDSGQMYGYDIVNDSLIAIDKATGEGTIIGSLGFDANFGQGMDYDSASGNLYLSAFNNGTFQAELRIADTTTGNTTLVNVLGTPGLSQLGWMAAASGGGSAGSAWASADPDSGVVPAGETMTFDVIFDATALYQVGDYTANLSFSGNFVNDVDTMPLTMHISCPTCGLLEGDITDAFTGDPLSANINVMGDGVEINVSGESYSLALPEGDYDFTVSANGYFSETATVSAVMGETTVTDFALTPIIALLDYMPDSFEQTIAMGEMASQELVIANDGTMAFDFAVSDVEIGSPEATMAAPMITCPEDEFGYSCTDSNEPGGPTYNFEDISGTGTAISLGDDQVSAPISLGFMFNFYEEDYSDIYVSSNGFLTVLAGQSSGCCSGQPIPTAGDPDGVIAGWWEDLNPSSGGSIHYETLGTAPNRRLIVQFTDVPHFGGANEVTMQYKLFESSNIIEVHYDMAPSDSGTHSAGIENQDGTSGVQYHSGGESLVTPLAVRYQTYQDALWLEQEPMTGTVEADDEMMIDIIFNASEITQTGTYTASLRIEGTFDNEGAMIPVVMHVEEPEPEMGMDIETPEMTIPAGEEMTQTLTLTNTGNMTLDWTSFTEEGSTRLVLGGECSGNNPEVSWLALEPTNGSIPPGESQDSEVSADTTDLAEGDYTGNICISIPEHEMLITIPVSLTVFPPTAVEMAELNAFNTSVPLGLLAAGMMLLVAGGYVAHRRRE